MRQGRQEIAAAAAFALLGSAPAHGIQDPHHQGVTGRGRSFRRGGFETHRYERNVLRTCCAFMARRLPASIQLQGAEDAMRDLLVAGLDLLPVLLTALVVRG